jgi:DNA-binding FadR family transcriptional regulator
MAGARPKEITQKVKAAEVVAEALRREIVTGNLRPGDKLLPEHLLQEQFGVSRPTLREAMRMLEAEALVRISRGQHGGATVSAPNKAVVARQVGVFLQREGATLADLWQARMHIEPMAVALAASNIQRDVTVSALKANIVAARAEIDEPIGFARISAQFVEILLQGCGNHTLRLFSLLMEDMVQRQYTHDFVPNYAAPVVGVNMRNLNLRAREKLIGLIETGKSSEAEAHWRNYLEAVAKQISAYRASMPIDVLRQPLEEGRKAVNLLRAKPGRTAKAPPRRKRA